MKRTRIAVAAVVVVTLLMVSAVWSATSLNNANAIHLYMYRSQVQSLVGYPDSVEHNANYRRNLEFYSTPDGLDVYQIFTGYLSNGQLGVYGNKYRPGRTSAQALANQLQMKGLTLIQTNYNSWLFQGNDPRTGRIMYAIVEMQGTSPVVTLLTREVYQGIM
ncbi:MAG: hypothetical protein U9R40_06725 [Synergistota bacterium]|nr:hypothetical protein [Synergistota bacterium]